MNINVNVNLSGNDEPPSMTPTEIGEAVINLLGGDLTKDLCNVSISAMGAAGTTPGYEPVPSLESLGPQNGG